MAKRNPNGAGTVRHNKARGRWEARLTVGFTPDGKPIRKMVTGPTSREVRSRMAALSASFEAGQEPAPRNLTVGKFLDQWADNALPGRVAPRTEQQYRDTIRLYLKPMIGQQKLKTLQPGAVSKMLHTLSTEGPPAAGRGKAPAPLSANTCRIVRAVLRRALRYAEVEGLVTRNVAALAQGVKLDRPRGRSLTPEQVRTLLEHLEGDRLLPAYVAAIGLGLRVGEIMALAWDDLDLDADPPRVHVRYGVTRVRGVGLMRGDTKTHGSERVLHLPAMVADAFRAHRKAQAAERLALGSDWPAAPLGADLVFRTPFGTAMDPDNFRHHVYRTTSEVFTPEAERPKEPGDKWPAEYRWTPHELRHSAASLLVSQGLAIEVVSATLGHSSIKVTADVYSHLFDKARSDAADAMTAAIWGVRT